MIFSDQTSISVLSLLGMVVTATTAAVTDWRSWRIPNRLLAASAAAALMMAVFDPYGLTLQQALLGAMTGFAMLLPLYLLRGMSAGDVKLMAVLGIYAGPVATIDLILMSFLVSGLWSLGLLVIRTPSFQWAVLGMKTRLNMKITIGDASASKELGIHSKRGAFPFGVATGIATLAMAVSAGISMSNR